MSEEERAPDGEVQLGIGTQHPDIACALGRLIMDFALVELAAEALGKVHEQKTGEPFKYAYNPVAHDKVSSVIERSIKRVSSSALPTIDREKRLECLNRLRAANRRRNELIHGHYVKDGSGQVFLIGKVQKDGTVPRPQIMSAAALRADAEEVSATWASAIVEILRWPVLP